MDARTLAKQTWEEIDAEIDWWNQEVDEIKVVSIIEAAIKQGESSNPTRQDSTTAQP